MVEEDGSAPQAVVFVSDRSGAGLLRRERCLRLAAIPFEVRTERRVSGTYFMLCVRERDAVTAYLALQMGGCSKTVRLRQATAESPFSSLREMLSTLRDEAAVLLGWVVDLVWQMTPHLLTGPPEPQQSERSA